MKSNKKFDIEEEKIYDAFSQITVDTNNLKRRVEDMNYKNIKKPMRLSVAVAASLIFIVGSATVYATSGGLEQFLSRFNPTFGELATAPLIPVYAVDEGIHIEVEGVQQIGNELLLYISMQDLSGENRLSSSSRPSFGMHIDGQMMSGTSRTKILHFDENTNTAYYEIIFVGEVDMPITNTVELVASEITNVSEEFRVVAVGDWRMQVDVSNTNNNLIVWTDIQMEDFYIKYMSLSPFGLQIHGGHQWDIENPSLPEIEVELEKDSGNIKLSKLGTRLSSYEFSLSYYAEAPINVDEVNGIIIGGKHILIP